MDNNSSDKWPALTDSLLKQTQIVPNKVQSHVQLTNYRYVKIIEAQISNLFQKVTEIVRRLCTIVTISEPLELKLCLKGISDILAWILWQETGDNLVIKTQPTNYKKLFVSMSVWMSDSVCGNGKKEPRWLTRLFSEPISYRQICNLRAQTCKHTPTCLVCYPPVNSYRTKCSISKTDN